MNGVQTFALPISHGLTTIMNIRKVGIIGAGQMGNGIAHVCALAGYDVLLNDMARDNNEAALATIHGNLARPVKSGKITERSEKRTIRKECVRTCETRW